MDWTNAIAHQRVSKCITPCRVIQISERGNICSWNLLSVTSPPRAWWHIGPPHRFSTFLCSLLSTAPRPRPSTPPLLSPFSQSFAMLFLVFRFSFCLLVPMSVLHYSHSSCLVSKRDLPFSISSSSLHSLIAPSLLFSAPLRSSHDPPSESSESFSNTSVGIRLASCYLCCSSSAYGIWNSENIYFRNRESYSLESGIPKNRSRLFESRIQYLGSGIEDYCRLPYMG